MDNNNSRNSSETKTPKEWSRDDVAKWAEENFEFPEVSKWLYNNMVTGLDLLELTSAEKAQKAGLPYGLAAQLTRVVKTLGLSSAVDVQKISYKTRISFEKEEIISSFYSFEQFLANKSVALHGKDWRPIFVDTVGDQNLVDVNNKALILRVLDQLPEEATWFQAKEAFLLEVFPTANDKTWLGMLDELTPQNTDTMKTFIDKFSQLFKAIVPHCSTLQKTPSLEVHSLHEKIPKRFHDTILSKDPKMNYEGLEDYISVLKGNLSETFNTKQVWSDIKPSNNNNNNNNSHNRFKPHHHGKRSFSPYHYHQHPTSYQPQQANKSVKNDHHHKPQRTHDSRSSSFHTDKTKGSIGQQDVKTPRWCAGCQKDVYHSESNCWKLHPELTPPKLIAKSSQGTQSSQQSLKIMTPKSGGKSNKAVSKYLCLVSLRRNSSSPFKIQDVNHIHHEEVILRLALIDSGASDIFLSMNLANQLNCKVLPQRIDVDLADNEKSQCQRTDIVMQIQGKPVMMPAYAMESLQSDSSEDIIIGRSAFMTLGIRIVVPIESDDPLQRQIREQELHVSPSNSNNQYIAKHQQDKLMQAIKRSLDSNLSKRDWRSTHPMASNVEFHVPNEAEKWNRQYRISFMLRGRRNFSSVTRDTST